MNKLMLAALALLPFAAGCYVAPYPRAYYARHSYYRAWGPPAPIYVAPPRRAYW